MFYLFQVLFSVGIVGVPADFTHHSAVASPGSDVRVKRPAKSAKTETPWPKPMGRTNRNDAV